MGRSLPSTKRSEKNPLALYGRTIAQNVGTESFVHVCNLPKPPGLKDLSFHRHPKTGSDSTYRRAAQMTCRPAMNRTVSSLLTRKYLLTMKKFVLGFIAVLAGAAFVVSCAHKEETAATTTHSSSATTKKSTTSTGTKKTGGTTSSSSSSSTKKKASSEASPSPSKKSSPAAEESPSASPSASPEGQ